MTVIVTKNSSTASAVPTTSDLVQGELAVNVTDKRIFTENASTQIVELGTNPSTVTTATATVTGTLTANGTFASSNAVITGGSINSTPIGATTPSTVRGSTVTATTGFIGGLTGNVTGNLTGNVTGNVTGDLTGNVAGNLTAGSGTTTLNNLVVNGTVDFNAAVLSDLGSPVVSTDAATKGYVDTAVSNVIDAAPAALDTLNELAAALGDDANFSSTVTTALATKLPLAGGTMTGAIAMGTSKITGLGNPTSAQDAATKTYVDTADALKLNLTGGTMSGAIAMGTNKITGVGDPTLAQDAATKAYTDSILGSATSAADSAAAAATSASNAATSASNAATSATASAASATAAAASYDAFDDRYLGDKASDPTLDNDGNALLTGALYFNTTSDVMKVYDGSAWNIAAISSASPTFTGTVTADGLSLGDNDKAIFGDGNDLEIYHDGTYNWIKAASSQFIFMQADEMRLRSATGETYFTATLDGSTGLYYDAVVKLATTSTGIDVTGTATMDGLILDQTTNSISAGTSDGSDNARLFLNGGGTASINRGGNVSVYGNEYASLGGNIVLAAGDALTGGAVEGQIRMLTGPSRKRLLIEANGDISFYENTGTTPKFFWDASAESLGIGTSSPSDKLQIQDNSSGNSPVLLSLVNDTGGGANDTGVKLWMSGRAASATNRGSYIQAVTTNTNNAHDLLFATSSSGNAPVERLRIDSSGNVGIGATSLTHSLEVWRDGSNQLLLGRDGVGTYELGVAADDALTFEDAGVERMRIDSSGNVGIGTSSPASISGGTSVHGTLTIGSPDGSIVVDDVVGALSFSTFDASYTGTYADGITGEIASVSESSVGGAYGLAFYTGTTTGSNRAERLRIDSTGNVGIGTDDPSGLLDVADGNTKLYYAPNSDNSDLYIKAGFNTKNSTIVFNNNSNATTGSIDYDHNINSLLLFTTSSEAMRINSAGDILINQTGTGDYTTIVGSSFRASGFSTHTASANAALLLNRLSTDGDIAIFRKDNTTVGSIRTISGDSIGIGNGDAGLRFVSSTNRIQPVDMDNGLNSDALTSLGDTNKRFKDLHLSSTANVGSVNIDQNNAFTNTNITSANTNTDKGNFLRFMQVASGSIPAPDFSIGHAGDNTGDAVLRNVSSSSMKFYTNNTEKVRITANGELLVGKTATGIGTQGIQFVSGGLSAFTRDAGTALVLDRNTSDGEILQFRKDNAVIGSIGTNGNDLTIGTGDVGLKFNDAAGLISPWDMTANAPEDAAIDLGYSTGRFKDLYLSGGVYLGGTGAANQLDDYEEGTFTPVGFGVTYTTAAGVYTKIGDRVTWSASITFPTTSDTNVSRVPLPFAIAANQENRGNCSIGYQSVQGAAISNLTALYGNGVSYVSFYVGSTPKTNADLSTAIIYLGGSYKV